MEKEKLNYEKPTISEVDSKLLAKGADMGGEGSGMVPGDNEW